MAYYAIPDIHGNYAGLKAAVNDIMNIWSENDIIVFLGDYVDRGPDSKGVLLFLKELQEELGSDRIVCLKGNHEEMFLNWLHGENGTTYLKNDEDLSTIKSFLPELSKDYSHVEFHKIVDGDSDVDIKDQVRLIILRDEVIEWVKNLPLYYDRINEDNVLFVHAGIETELLGDSWKQWSTPSDYLWKFPPARGENPYGFDIVAGHVMTHHIWLFTEEPCYDMIKVGNYIYTDGGSPYNKKLNVLVVSNEKYIDLYTGKKIGEQ